MPKIPGVLAMALLAAVLSGVAWGWNACRWLRKERWETEPLAPRAIEKVRIEDRERLGIDRVRFHSDEMQSPRFFLALVPKSAGPPAEVLILNHGWFDRPEFLLRHLKVHEVYERLLAAGAVRPALVVMPDVRFPDHFRRNSNKFPFPQYLTLVAEEARSAIVREYGIGPEREKWGIGGFSFGGYLSLDIARRYSARFESVSAVSAFTDEEWKFWGELVRDPGPLDARGRGKQTLVAPGPPPRLLLACGTSDRFYERMVALHERFQKLGIAHEWSRSPGGHTWEYWGSVLERMLRFHLGK